MKKDNKTLLGEGTIRRMMKLAEIEGLSDKFIQGRHPQDLEEDFEEMAMGEDEIDVDAPEDEIPDMGGEEVEGSVEISTDEAENLVGAFDAADPVVDKLRDAVAPEEEISDIEDEVGDEVSLDAEEDDAMEIPGGRYMQERTDDDLYEAALKGLNLNVSDDKKEVAEKKINNLKNEIYRRVITRLLKEVKK